MDCFLGSIFKVLEPFDIFSLKFTLNFKKKKGFTTWLGAMASLMIIAICSYYGISLLSQMLNRTLIQTNINRIRTDIAKDPIDITLNQEGIYIGVSWIGNLSDNFDMIEAGLGMVTLSLVENTPYGEEMIQQPISSIELEKCNETNFPIDYEDPSMNYRKGFTFYCFKRNDLMKLVQRESHKGRSFSFGINAIPCINDICTGPDYNLLRFYSGLHLTIISKYFDDSDPLNPVKTYVHDNISLVLSQGDTSMAHCSLSRHKYVVNDWHSIITGSTYGEFLDIDSCVYRSQTRSDNHTMAAIVFNVNDFVQTYETTVISFLEVLGQVGGLFEILSLTLSLLLKIVLKFLFKKNVKQIEKTINKNEEWFSYPANVYDSRKSRKNKRKARYGFLGSFEPSNKVSAEPQPLNAIQSRNSISNDHQHYVKQAKNRLKSISKTLRKSKLSGVIEKELDIVNVARSLQELKLYVSYLMDRDKINIECISRSIDLRLETNRESQYKHEEIDEEMDEEKNQEEDKQIELGLNSSSLFKKPQHSRVTNIKRLPYSSLSTPSEGSKSCFRKQVSNVNTTNRIDSESCVKLMNSSNKKMIPPSSFLP
ncbi:unnamed protein product [Moneuplotes crassus]|uniref:Uncharacterized protein n=1 Tax=Euplotes crassus TaxID=5936 RepID=A0AAD1U929_EUPCR|nr:unnamed protein product [Moneuplotes crassus]